MKYEILFYFSGSGKLEIEANSFSEAEKVFNEKKLEMINTSCLKGFPRHILAIRQVNGLADKMMEEQDRDTKDDELTIDLSDEITKELSEPILL